MIKERIKRTFPIPQILRLINPDYSYCGICGLPWNHCKTKDVRVSARNSVFATCSYCWEHSELYEIKIAYIDVYRKWQEMDATPKYSLGYLLRQVEVEYIRTHGK